MSLELSLNPLKIVRACNSNRDVQKRYIHEEFPEKAQLEQKLSLIDKLDPLLTFPWITSSHNFPGLSSHRAKNRNRGNFHRFSIFRAQLASQFFPGITHLYTTTTQRNVKICKFDFLRHCVIFVHIK